MVMAKNRTQNANQFIATAVPSVKRVANQ